MSGKKKKQREASMPASSAGLLRFYEENTDSIVKIRPEVLLIITIAVIISVILAHVFLKGAI